MNASVHGKQVKMFVARMDRWFFTLLSWSKTLQAMIHVVFPILVKALWLVRPPQTIRSIHTLVMKCFKTFLLINLITIQSSCWPVNVCSNCNFYIQPIRAKVMKVTHADANRLRPIHQELPRPIQMGSPLVGIASFPLFDSVAISYIHWTRTSITRIIEEAEVLAWSFSDIWSQLKCHSHCNLILFYVCKVF